MNLFLILGTRPGLCHICMYELLARLYESECHDCVSIILVCNLGRILSSGDPLYRVFVKHIIIGKADDRTIVQ
jgi:hypothetical protein